MPDISVSKQEKKLIDDLLNDNVDAIRKSLDGKLLPQNVEQYMDNVLKSENINTESFLYDFKLQKSPYMFYCYYKHVMYEEDGNKRDIKPYTFENAEQQFIKENAKKYHGITAVSISRLKPNGIEEAVADTFGKWYINDHDEINEGYWFRAFNLMSPEHRNTVAKLMTEEISRNLKNQENNEAYLVSHLLPKALKFYNEIGEEEKKYMRSILLRWRTSGDNSERRHKADIFKKALEKLKKGHNKIEQDETIKAISHISYTQSSSLNRLNSENIELSFEMEKDADMRKKSAYINNKANSMKKAFDKFGVNMPFEWEDALIDGCKSWWYSVGYDKENSITHREEVKPIYIFKSKDTIELAGAAIYKYDRIEGANALMMSANRVKDREISVEEYKNLLNEQEVKIKRLSDSSLSKE